MDQYTEILTRMSDVLSPDDDQYEEKLLAIAATFRSFGQAITSFLFANGFSGDTNNIDEKANYLKDKFKAADIRHPVILENGSARIKASILIRHIKSVLPLI